MLLMSDSSPFRKFVRSWWRYLAFAILTLAGAITWLSHEYPNKKQMLKDALALLRPEPAPPPKEASAPPVAPAPEPKKAEPKKAEPRKVEPKKAEAKKPNVTGLLQLVPMPCIENVAGITKAVSADDNHEHNFKVLFGPRTACVTLRVTGVEQGHCEFKTASGWAWHSPTIYVNPASPDDLEKCRVGRKLKIEGMWQRYFRMIDQPDQIFINEARITEVEE